MSLFALPRSSRFGLLADVAQEATLISPIILSGLKHIKETHVVC